MQEKKYLLFNAGKHEQNLSSEYIASVVAGLEK